jgi:hypothetical protein
MELMVGWTNFADQAVDNKWGYQSTNQLFANAKVSLYRRPWRPRDQTATWLIRTDADHITFKAGDYFIGDQILSMATDLTWTWVASGHNKGVISGDPSDSAATYYLYAINDGGAVGIVASTTGPTARFDSPLPGSLYDTNLYLGAWINNFSTEHIFRHHGNYFWLLTWPSQSTTTYLSYLGPMSLGVPATASHVYWRVRIQSTLGTGALGLISLDGATEQWRTPICDPEGVESGSATAHFLLPNVLIYIKNNVASGDFVWGPMGWWDKFLV